MTGVLAGIAASLILVLAFRRRPVVWVSAGILTAVFFPTVATRAWFLEAGNLGKIHPATWIFLVGFLVTLAFSSVKVVVRRVRTAFVLALGLWTAAISLVILWFQSSSISVFALLYMTPLVAFLAINSAVTRGDNDLWRKLVPVVLTAAAGQSVLALVQYVTHTSVFFGHLYSTNYWWQSYLVRALGTFDSPLDLAAFLTMALPLTGAIRRTPATFVLAALLAVGVIVTGSRIGIVLAAAVIVWIVLVRSANVVSAAIISIIIGLVTLVLVSSSLSATLLARFVSRGGEISTEVRSDALAVGLDLATKDVFNGYGVGYAYYYSKSSLRSSFEDGYLATAIDLGLLVAVALVLIQLWAVFNGRGVRLLFRVPGMLAIVWGFSYSSFVSSSTFGTLSWTFIALSSIAGLQALPVAVRPAKSSLRGVSSAVGPASSRSLLGKP